MRGPVAALLLLSSSLPALEGLNLILPNDRSLPMGEIGSIEASAIVARTTGTAASWYNPAGLAGQVDSEVMGAASIYDYSQTSVDSVYGNDERRTVSALPGAAGISEPLPTWLGGDNAWSVGLMVATPVYWRTSVAQQETATTPSGAISVSNTYDATYEVYLPTLALGRKFGRHSWGFSASAYIHQISVASASTGANVPAQTIAAESYQFHGRSILLRAGAGWQWKTDEWALGATAALPGIPVYRDGDRTDNSQLARISTGEIITVSGSTGNYELNLDAPAQFTVGAARTAPTWAIEIDLTAVAGASPRDVFPGYQLDKTIVTPSGTTASSFNLKSTSSNRRANLNGALGLAQRIDDRWWAHAGILSDASGLASSELFSTVDLWTATVGLSLKSEHALTTAGVASTWNTNGTTTSVDLPTGAQASSDVKIRNWRVILGTAYRF